jgi:hypothetical protein
MINKRNIQIYGLIWLIPTSADNVRDSVVGETAFLGFKNAVLVHVQLDLAAILPEREWLRCSWVRQYTRSHRGL